MCDYSLRHLASRPAEVDDKLVVSKFRNSLSVGFTEVAGDANVAVCVMPGTELAFDESIVQAGYLLGIGNNIYEHKTARFRQINLDSPCTHHDALELPDGEVLLLHSLKVGQTATVLQLPAEPKTADEAKAQQRLEVVS
jgi:hypothetical protein